MAVHLSYVDSYKYYGRCVKLENEFIELLITVEIGPRIIYFGWKGGENLFFNAQEGTRISNSPLFKQIFGEDQQFCFYGGHRMWLAPQLMFYTECPDNDPLNVRQIENGVVLTGPEAKVIGFIPEMTVVMEPDKPMIHVKTTFTNTADTPRKQAAWQITQCAPGGVGFIPFAKPFRMMQRKPFSELTLADFDFKPNPPGASLLMFVGGFTDPRLRVDDHYITFSFDGEMRRPLKIGSQDYQGYAMYANKGYMLRWDFIHDTEAEYTDGGCSFEAYTDADFTEMETLGPVKIYAKGESISHEQTISVQPLKSEIPDLNDRAAVEAFVEMHKEAQ